MQKYSKFLLIICVPESDTAFFDKISFFTMYLSYMFSDFQQNLKFVNSHGSDSFKWKYQNYK